MATVTDLGIKIRSLLDDDSTTSPRYDYTKDIIPAMNSAIDYLVAVFSAGFESKQIKPEVLANLIVSKGFDVVRATSTGTVVKVDITKLNYNTEVWRILGIEPNPSVYTSVVEYSSNKMAQRMTLEQWNHSQEDPFARGTNIEVPSDFLVAAYTGPGMFYGEAASGGITINIVAAAGTFTRTSGSYVDDGFAIGQIVTFSGFSDDGNNTAKIITGVSSTVLTTTDLTGLSNESGGGDEEATSANLYLLLRPFSIFNDDLKVAIYYLKAPTPLTTISSTIDFPISLHNLIVQKTLQYISYQHSKDSKYFQITDKEVKELIALMSV